MQYQRHWRRWGLLAAAVALAVGLLNCSGNPNGSGERTASTPPNTLVYGSGGEPVSLESGNITDGNSIIVQNQIYNRLIEFEPGTTELRPGLATDWQAAAGGREWTLTLRQGVRFHDGTPLNAEAVQFNLERWWDPEHPHGYRDAGKGYEPWAYLFGGFKGDPDSLVRDITVTGSHTLRIALSQPFAAFPDALASGYFGIASPSAIRQAGADYSTPTAPAVGTGPFQLDAWRSGDRVELSAHPDYWRDGLPRTEQLVIRFVSDPAARLAELRAGALDLTVDFAPDQRSALERSERLDPVLRPAFNVGYLALNPSHEPLAQPQVRRVIAAALDREAIVEAFWQGLGTADAHFTPPALDWAQSPQVSGYGSDTQRARQALARAGYPDGFELNLWYMPVSRPYYPTPKPIAEAFAAELSDIGIEVNLQTKDWAAYLSDRNQDPGFQAFMLGWSGDYGDPDNFYYPHFGPTGTDDLGDWQNERVVELLERARRVQAREERAQLYAQVNEILFEEAVRIPVVHAQPLLGKRANITGWDPSPVGAESLERVRKTAGTS
ncbi:MAG: ABC transporter substrate-binding protein [Cyanobacteria bacterium QS_8_64_29]|nr:MAG: ABC transporter substrate-binding protein [Cyanobacteria bacterium QS_8_64_29]